MNEETTLLQFGGSRVGNHGGDRRNDLARRMVGPKFLQLSSSFLCVGNKYSTCTVFILVLFSSPFFLYTQSLLTRQHVFRTQPVDMKSVQYFVIQVVKTTSVCLIKFFCFCCCNDEKTVVPMENLDQLIICQSWALDIYFISMFGTDIRQLRQLMFLVPRFFFF